MARALIYITLLTITFACSKKPVPCMEVEGEGAPVGDTVTFRSCSKKTLSLEWFMQGPPGAPENEQGWSDIEIKHAFSIPGTYTITLNVYNEFSYLGDMESIEETIQVK